MNVFILNFDPLWYLTVVLPIGIAAIVLLVLAGYFLYYQIRPDVFRSAL